MIWLRPIRWIGGILSVLVVLAILFIAIFGWNWLRMPIERLTLDKTGRELVIGGDITVKFGWPLPRIQGNKVSFANPSWAKEKQMVTADEVEITVDASQLLRLAVVFPDVRLKHPVVFLEESADGRKNWLLDLEQKNEEARVEINRLTLDQGSLAYDDVGRKTSVRAEVSSSNASNGANAANASTPPNSPRAGGELSFTAQGRYKDLPFKAKGSGGPVLALRDVETPYPLKADFTVGKTVVKIDGTITSLLKFSAMDMRLDLRGESLAQLFPVLGIAFPETRAYTTEGRLVHSGKVWRYEKFTGRVGASDIAGFFHVDNAGERPLVTADLASNRLDLADLGPLIGARSGSLASAIQAAPLPSQMEEATPAKARVLPELPFKTDRWGRIDAEVTLKAANFRSGKLPLDGLDTHLSLRDSVLTLAPLNFGIAGGHLDGTIVLDGRKDPIHAQVKLRARKILLAKLFPTVTLNKASIGEINGEFDLAGDGNSIRRMLADANGKIGLVISGGEISQLMMERVGLHLWEMLELNVTGDKRVKLRCAVADFNVKKGSMNADALIFDTEVTTIIGTGHIDLVEERLDLTLNQRTKNTSPFALRSPIHVRGNFARPEASVDKGRMALRAAGAIALGLVNPFLALIPLIDAGPGSDSDCGQLVRDAKALPHGKN
jgi:AsmA protein